MEFKKLDFLRTPICGLQRRLEESWETKSRRTRRIQEIAEKIGRPALEIKSIGRVGAKKK